MYACATPPCILFLLPRGPLRTRHVCWAEHPVIWVGVYWGLGVARDWSSRGGGLWHPGGEYDGVASETAQDVEKHRLRGCRDGMSTAFGLEQLNQRK